MKTICLVACAAKKKQNAARADEIYISSLFQKSRGYAQSCCDEWFILSAKHGVLPPATKIEPYNITLNNMGKEERRVWAAGVMKALWKMLSSGDKIVFLAGMAYREFLVGPLEEMGLECEVPMKGMRIGEQLSWLDKISRARQGS